MIMAGINGQQELAAEGVAEVKFVRTRRVAFGADAEQLGLD